MISPVMILTAFIFGFFIGALVIYKFRKKEPKKKPIDIYNPPPAAAASRQLAFSSETDTIQKIRADTLEKKILYEEELSLVFRMGQEMFSNVNIENISKVMVDNVTKLTNSEICTLLLEDRKTLEFAPIYGKGVKKEFLDKMRFKLGESISGWVMEKGELFVIYDIENNVWFKEQNRGEYFVYSLVSIPLMTKNRVIGVLNLSNKAAKQKYTEEEIAFVKGMANQAAVAIQNANLYEQVQDNYLRTITALAFALDARDSYTRQHSENVTKYSVAIAQQLNLSIKEIDCIRRAGLLHDIGKIGIRDGVLLKPTKLNDEEYNDIKNHPAKGETIVNALPFLKEEAKIIRHHHERFDGKGYPDGIAGEKIEMGARILAVADSFDAMVENRVYRKALDIAVAFDELKKNSGTQFDPGVVDALIKVIEKNPGFLDKKSEIFPPDR